MREKFVLQVFYSNINLHSAGTEKYIKEQISALNRQEIDAIVLFPIRKRVPLFDLNMWGLMLNDTLKGVYSTAQLLELFAQWSQEGKHLCAVFLQHLMNVDLEGLKELLLAVKGCPTIVYLHDFYTACLQYNLLQNDTEYCGDAMVYPEKCAQCSYYQSAVTNRENMEQFLNEISHRQLYFIAPSSSTAGLWKKAFPQFESKLVVIEHQNRHGQYVDNTELVPEQEELRVAYIGSQNPNKGWNSWEQAVTTLSRTRNYAFYHLGHTKVSLEHVKNIEVSIQKDGPEAMIRALRENKIHVAVLNSIWPETYSYTYFECYAANAFVLTNARSGNIASQTQVNGNGIVLERPNELVKLLSNEAELRAVVNAYRQLKKYGPEQLENNLQVMAYLNLNTIGWFNGQLKKEKNLFLHKLLIVCLYNSRYKKLGQTLALRTRLI